MSKDEADSRIDVARQEMLDLLVQFDERVLANGGDADEHAYAFLYRIDDLQKEVNEMAPTSLPGFCAKVLSLRASNPGFGSECDLIALESIMSDAERLMAV